jgi:hypothetical protein
MFKKLIRLIKITIYNIMSKSRKKKKNRIKSLKRANQQLQSSLKNVEPKVQQRPMCASADAIIYKSEMEFVSRCILDYPNIETGGQMFGYWTDNGTPVVLYTIGPGPRANHQTAFFNQDINYLESVGNILTQKYGLQHIGEWHSHHQLGLARPSVHDASSMANGLLSSGRERFLLCIGNCTSTTTSLNPFNFVSGEGTRYVDAQWVIKHVDSPFRAIIDAELRNALFMPNAKRPNYEGMGNVSEPQVENPIRKPQYDSEYWLSDKKNNLVLKTMMDFLNSDPSVANLKTMLDDNKQVHLTLFWRRRFPTIISFPAGFPNVPPKFKVYLKDWTGTNATECSLILPDWSYNGDILSAFVEYYDQITIN